MIDPEDQSYVIRRISAADPASGFRCGARPLDDYFARHALPNEEQGIGRTYVLEATRDDIVQGLPAVLGFCTLSMATVASDQAATAVAQKLPHYPLPVALIGRLAVDERARGRRPGESLLMDALSRVVNAAELVGCFGIVVDAKDDKAEAFYSKYELRGR